jgi:uncharacterized protein (DUF58 family)
MITPRGAALLTGALLLWAVGRLLGVAELYVVAAAAAAVVVLGAVAVTLASATVAVRRGTSSTRLLAGTPAEVTLELRNDARLPTPLLLVEDRCPYALLDGTADPGVASARPRFVVTELRPGQTTVLAYPLRAARRGRHEVGPVELRVRDPFSTVQRTKRYQAVDELIVYPPVEPLPEGIVRGVHHGSGSSEVRRLFSTGDEFYTMREYTTGDDLRMIHWPSTAHRQTLMVRQQEMPWQSQATVFCDTRALAHRGVGPDATLETAVNAAASIVWHLADHRYGLRFCTESDQRPPTTQDWSTILDRLAVLEASRSPGLGPVLTRLRASGAEGLLAVIVAAPPGDDPVPEHPDARAVLQAGRGFPDRVAVVVDVGGHGSHRAAQLAGLLGSAGWRAVVLPHGQRLGPRWAELTGSRRRRTPAFEPDAAHAPRPAGYRG